ncbi:lipid II flippase FtsW [Holospora elegans E1]|uniref:Probable peptidoglycan glycosyltransferase FtsW n=1 Tax=Holospora elegans E1 TaxID=1427503 RepID=A0A023DX35_9PROT|nr:FtsW/RodA/SpoVE family cell cycle protein [Holospora elegans]GAJ45797.1 lipid II flippase FtsW [Holospora elegans E1]
MNLPFYQKKSQEDSPPPESLWAFWWNAIDRWILICSIMLIVLGSWLILAASPSIAAQHGWTTFVLLKRHLVFVVFGVVLLFLGSFLPKEHLKATVYTIGISAWAGLWAVVVFGVQVKGAKRWLNIFGISVQPSEFIKPAFCMGCAYFLSEYSQPNENLRFLKVLLLFIIVSCPLLLQPDLGTVFLLLMSALTQSFIAGLGWGWVLGMMGAGIVSLIPIVLYFPHAALRLRMFFGYESSDPFGKQYQILQSLKSFCFWRIVGKGAWIWSCARSSSRWSRRFYFCSSRRRIWINSMPWNFCVIRSNHFSKLKCCSSRIAFRTSHVNFRIIYLFYVSSLSEHRLRFTFGPNKRNYVTFSKLWRIFFN